MGRGHFLGVLDVKNRGGDILWVYGVNKKIYIYRKYIELQRKLKILTRVLVRGNIRRGLGGKHFEIMVNFPKKV